MNRNKEKSRNLSIYEFFQILQLEWLVAELRSRIYFNEQDKKHWNTVKDGKKVTIDNIAEKNNLPTIFTDSEMLRQYQQKVYNEKSHPKFTYKNEENKRLQEPLDLINYYSHGTDVRYEYNEEVKVGKVKSYIPYASTMILVDLETKEERIVNVVGVIRIL